MINDYKIVNFNEYCQKCEYFDLDEYKEPCHECLNNPVNMDSHKPVNFKEKEKKDEKKKEKDKN